MAVKRAIVVAASAFVAVNIWTGAPLLALWIGSRLVGRIALSSGAVAIVVAVLATTIYLMAALLARLNGIYRRLLALDEERRVPQWLSPLADESAGPRARAGLTPVEWTIVISVQLAVLALLVWFFFVAGSPLPQ
jgi:hypothetical protein